MTVEAVNGGRRIKRPKADIDRSSAVVSAGQLTECEKEHGIFFSERLLAPK
jgi:hypothetical protein